MRIFTNFNKLHTALLLPFVICSVFAIVSELLLIISGYFDSQLSEALTVFSYLFDILCGYAFCSFAAAKFAKGKILFKALWSIFCLLIIQASIYSFGNTVNKSYFLGLLVGILCGLCFNRLDDITAYIISFFVSLTLGVLIGFSLEYYNDFVMMLASLTSDKGGISSVIFSSFNYLFKLFGSNDFENMIFTKSYGGTMFFGSELVTGVKELFARGYTGQLVSTYMSGHYYLLLSIFGIGIGMMSSLRKSQKIALIFTIISTLISGRIELAILFFLLESPFLSISVLLLSVISYLASYVLKLSVGYVNNGGLIELILGFNDGLYIVVGGVIFIALGYFVYKYCFEKYGISDCLNIYIPTRLNGVVKALGGIKNIVRFKGNDLEIRNPKLIDILSLSCEVDGNIVKSSQEEFLELKEYLYEC